MLKLVSQSTAWLYQYILNRPGELYICAKTDDESVTVCAEFDGAGISVSLQDDVELIDEAYVSSAEDFDATVIDMITAYNSSGEFEEECMDNESKVARSEDIIYDSFEYLLEGLFPSYKASEEVVMDIANATLAYIANKHKDIKIRRPRIIDGKFVEYPYEK